MLTTLLPFAVALLMSPAQVRDQEFFNELSHWREKFESVLQRPAKNLGYVTVWSETLGPAHSEALYPIGPASERFVISYTGGEADEAGVLMYQRRRGNHTFVDWHVPLLDSKRGSRGSGTIRAFLQKERFRISPRARLTSAMSRQLASKRSYASYIYHPEMEGYACLVKPNGSRTGYERSHLKFAITSHERAMIKGHR
ncbi:MAG: hypothetical protein ACAH95_06875 [Fimbriimonas sp.]